MKTLIKNGLIVDGLLNKPFKGEVLIEGNKIAEIGTEIKEKAIKLLMLKAELCVQVLLTHTAILI